MAFFDEDQLSAIQDFYDELISSFGVLCKLYYQPKFVDGSSNLKLVDSTYASNSGPHGGPIQGLQEGQGGINKKTQESTENITLVIEWEIKDAKLYGKTAIVPFGIIRVHGFLTDLTKIQHAIEIQVKIPNFPIQSGRYRFLGQGEDVFSIIQGRYFIGYCERIS